MKIQHLYRQSVAYDMHLIHRTSMCSSKLSNISDYLDFVPDTLDGTLVDADRLRLFQSAISTRLLGATLAALAMCLIVF